MITLLGEERAGPYASCAFVCLSCMCFFVLLSLLEQAILTIYKAQTLYLCNVREKNVLIKWLKPKTVPTFFQTRTGVLGETLKLLVCL